MSSTVTNVGSLRRLLPTGSWLGTLVRRAARRGRMGLGNSLTVPGHGIVSGQMLSAALSGSPNVLSLASSVMSIGQTQRKRKTQHLRRTFFASSFLLSPICNPCSLLIYRREGRAPPLRGRINSTHHASHNTQLSSNEALSVLSTFPSETWDLSLSCPFVTPTTNLSMLITRATTVNWT